MTSLFSHIDTTRFRGKRVGIALGGTSSERDISLKTGHALAQALKQKGYDVELYDLPNDLDTLRNQPPAALLLAMHGGFGENGILQGWLELEKIPYTGSRVAASAFAMDKFRAKQVLRAAHIRLADDWFLSTSDLPELLSIHENDALRALLYQRFSWSQYPSPLILKRNNSGSSFGVQLAVTEEEFFASLSQLVQEVRLDDPSDGILIERVIPGPEYSVGFYDQICLGAIKVTPSEAFYDIKAKYQSGDTIYTPVEGELLQRLESIGRCTFNALGCQGVARVDVIGETENLCVLEVNSLPGMTETSLVPKMASRLGLSFPDFAELLLCSASLSTGE